MYELIKVSENCYYIDCPSKIGIIKINDTDVCLIDSGNNKDAGKRVRKILDANGWTLKIILNTHSHGDHIGGNRYLQEQTGCKKVAMVVLGLEVAHAHIHLIPMNSENDVDFRREKLKLSPEEFAEIASSLAL